MMRRRREERRTRARRTLGLVIATVAGVVLIGAWLGWAAVNVSPSLNANLCPPEDRIAEEVLLILDATDDWSDVRELAIRREVAGVLDSVARFSRITVHVVEPSEKPGSTVRLTVCNPGTLEQIEKDSRDYRLPRHLISNEDLVESYRSQFDILIDSVVAEVVAVEGQATSPIMETIREAVLTTPAKPPSEIYLISDMYQNSSLYSAYRRGEWNLQVADSLADVYVQGTQELAGANVTIFLLSPDDATPDPDAIRRFWNRFFAQQRAVLRRIERVEG